MGSTFGPNQLYAVEQAVNDIADVLIHAGFEVGEEADGQDWHGAPMGDMSGALARLLKAERDLSGAVGLLRAYEMRREALEVTA
jgi:hypothetical protein